MARWRVTEVARSGPVGICHDRLRQLGWAPRIQCPGEIGRNCLSVALWIRSQTRPNCSDEYWKRVIKNDKDAYRCMEAVILNTVTSERIICPEQPANNRSTSLADATFLWLDSSESTNGNDCCSIGVDTQQPTPTASRFVLQQYDWIEVTLCHSNLRIHFTMMMDFFPHLCVGFLFLVVHYRLTPSPRRLPPPPSHPLAHTQLTHTQLTVLTPNLLTPNLLTPNLLTHNLLYSHPTCSHPTCSHPTCSHTTYSHTHTQLTVLTPNLLTTQLTHTHTQLTVLTPNLFTPNLLAHNLLYSHPTCSHPTYSHTHTQLTVLTPNLLTPNLLTPNLLTHNLLYSHPTCSHPTCSHPTCSHPTYSHTTYCTHTQLAHTQLVHTQLAHTQLAHTQHYSHPTCSHPTCSHPTCSHPTYSHTHTQLTVLTPNLLTPNLLTTNLLTHTTYCTRTQLAHTQLAHTQLTHTQLTVLTPNLLTPNLLTPNLLTHNLLYSHPTCSHPWWHRCVFCVAGVALMALGWLWWRAWVPVDAVDAAAVCVAGVALGDIDVHSAWQAWQLATSTCTLCGRHDTYGTGLALVARLVPDDAAPLCVAGVVLGDIGFRFVWQVWRLATSIFTLCGRRGTYGTGLALVAFVTHNSFTHNFVAHFFHTQLCHTFLSHTTLSHMSFAHNLVTHTNSFTHNFATHNSFTHATCHTQLCHTHTQLFHTRNFVTHNAFTHNSVTHATLSHAQRFHTQLFHTHTTLSHTPLSHITFYTQLCHVQFAHTHNTFTYKNLHTHTQNCHTHSSFTQPVLHHLLSLSCLSHLIFTSGWWLLEETDMWGYPVLSFANGHYSKRKGTNHGLGERVSIRLVQGHCPWAQVKAIRAPVPVGRHQEGCKIRFTNFCWAFHCFSTYFHCVSGYNFNMLRRLRCRLCRLCPFARTPLSSPPLPSLPCRAMGTAPAAVLGAFGYAAVARRHKVLKASKESKGDDPKEVEEVEETRSMACSFHPKKATVFSIRCSGHIWRRVIRQQYSNKVPVFCHYRWYIPVKNICKPWQSFWLNDKTMPLSLQEVTNTSRLKRWWKKTPGSVEGNRLYRHIQWINRINLTGLNADNLWSTFDSLGLSGEMNKIECASLCGCEEPVGCCLVTFCNIHAQLGRFQQTMSCHVMPQDSDHWSRTAKLDAKALRKMGLMCLGSFRRNLT